MLPRGIFLKRIRDLYVRMALHSLRVRSNQLQPGEPRSIYIARDWEHYNDTAYVAYLQKEIKLVRHEPKPDILEPMEAWPLSLYY